MTDLARFFICTMATGTDWLEHAMLVAARSADEARAVFKEHEAVAPTNVYEVRGAGSLSGVVGLIWKVGEDEN